MCGKCTFSCQTGALVVDWAQFELRGHDHRRNALFRGRRASLLEGGAPYLFRRAPSWAKEAPFRTKRAILLAGRHPYNAQIFGVKIRQWLRISANGDENGAHSAFSAGVLIFLSCRNFHLSASTAQVRQFPLGRGCQPAPAAPLPPDPPLGPGRSARLLNTNQSVQRTLAPSLFLRQS